MKKLLVLGLAIFLVVAFTLPAAALENKLGGYSRVRFLTYYNANGKDDGTGDTHKVDTRTRLYYTAVINDDLKFVFNSEHDSEWGGATYDTTKPYGGSTTYGRVGSDGYDFQVRKAYIDFNMSDFNFMVGTQSFEFGRGLIVSDEGSGVSLVWRGSKTIVPALYWMRYNEGGTNKSGQDEDIYHGLVIIKAGDMQIIPHLTYWYSNDGGGVDSSSVGTAGEQLKVYFAGVDFSMKLKSVDFTLTGIYEGGDYNDTQDVSAFALDGKFNVKVANFGIHGEALYGTGDDNTDNTQDAFSPPPGYSYTWSEGAAKGDIDSKPFAAGSFDGEKRATNLMAFNLGCDFNMTKTWNARFDFWNINLAEDDAAGNSDVGNEVSIKLKGQVIDNLDLLLVGAYMFAGDAFYSGVNEGNPIELGAQLSVNF